MNTTPICLRNKADQFYGTIEYLRFTLRLPAFDAEPYLKQVINQAIFHCLMKQPYATFLDFAKDASIDKDAEEAKCEQC